jgi:hypothetical protein
LYGIQSGGQLMDVHEAREVRRLVKYCHRRNTHKVVEQGTEHGRLNKRKLMREGMTRPEIDAIVASLRKKLKDYRDG